MLRNLFFVINKSTYYWQRFFCLIATKIKLICNGVEYLDYRCYGVPYICIEKDCRMKWGEHFALNNGLYGNQIGFATPCIFRCYEGGNIIIKNNVGMSQATLIAKGADITIGNNVKLGGGVKIYTTDFHSLNYMNRRDWILDSQNKACAPINIGDDCFIGAGTIILKGVTIGSRSTVGAGSVVTKSIPSDEIWAGNPAKFIRKIK